MAMFEPLREGFRELNRLVQDRQTFNAQNEAREAQDIRNNSILASQLEERAFNRASREKQLLMGEEMNVFNMDLAQKKYDQAAFQFDVNRNMKEQQMEADAQEAQVNLAWRRQQITASKNDQQEMDDYNRPVPVKSLITDAAGFAEASDEDKQKIAELYGGIGFDSEDDIVDENGDSVLVSRRMTKVLQPQLRDILSYIAVDTPKEAYARIDGINQELVELKAKAKKVNTGLSGDVKQKPMIAAAKAQIASKQAELAKQEALTGVDAVKHDLETQIGIKTRALRQQVGLGDPQVSVTEGELKALRDQLQDIRDTESAETVARARAGGKSGKTVQKMIVKRDAAGRVVDEHMVTINKNVLGKISPAALGYEGWDFSELAHLQKQEDSDRQKLFRQAASDIYKVKSGTDYYLEPQNEELYHGMMRVMELMRDNKTYADKKDTWIANHASEIHAQTILEYMDETFKIAATPVPDGLTKEQTEEFTAELAELQEEADVAATEILGSVPTETAYERLIERNTIERLALPEPKKNKRWLQ